MIPMLLMQLGEVVFGGVGCGLYGMLAFAILTVFIAGLMVGRTHLNLVDWLSQFGEGNEVYMKGFLGRMLFSGAVSYTHLILLSTL